MAAEKTKEEQSLFSSIDVVHSEKVKPGKNHLINQVQVLQNRVNNLSIQKRKKSHPSTGNQRNIFGLELIDIGNLVHSAIVSGARLAVPWTTRWVLQMVKVIAYKVLEEGNLGQYI